MATIRWAGTAPAVAQVSTAQVTAYDVATTYKLTIGNKVVSVIAQGSINLTAAGLATAWNALSATQYPEHSEVTASSATDTVTLTADVAGRPFTCTSSVSGGAGTIGAVATGTASAGPNHWDTAANWSGNAVPVGADTVHIEDSSVSILYGLDQNSTTLTALNIAANYTGQIGLPQRNQGGYDEYRTTHLTISSTNVRIGYGPGAGSGRIKLNTLTVLATVDVDRTGTTVEPGVPSLCWKGTHASGVVNVNRGYVGIGFFGLDSATVLTLRVGMRDSKLTDADVICGAGCTLTTANQLGGKLEVNSNLTTANIRGGIFTFRMAATLTTLDMGAYDAEKNKDARAVCYYNSSGTLTTANVRWGGTLDFSQDQRAKTVTTLNAFRGASIINPAQVAAVTLAPAGGATPGDFSYNPG